MTNAEFARFVAETGHVTVAETAPFRRTSPVPIRPCWCPAGVHADPGPSARPDPAVAAGASWRTPQGPGATGVTSPTTPSYVAWGDAAAYARWANRLPTGPVGARRAARLVGRSFGWTAEWADELWPTARCAGEHLARAVPLAQRGPRQSRPHLTGRQLPANGGLHDMIGNTWGGPDPLAALARRDRPGRLAMQGVRSGSASPTGWSARAGRTCAHRSTASATVLRAPEQRRQRQLPPGVPVRPTGREATSERDQVLPALLGPVAARGAVTALLSVVTAVAMTSTLKTIASVTSARPSDDRVDVSGSRRSAASTRSRARVQPGVELGELAGVDELDAVAGQREGQHAGDHGEDEASTRSSGFSMPDDLPDGRRRSAH